MKQTNEQMIAEWLKTNTPKACDMSDEAILKEKNFKKVVKTLERRAASGK